MELGNFMMGWAATAVLCAATVVASLSLGVAPCFAQRNSFRSAAPQYQNHPQPHPAQGHAGDWLRRYKNVPPREQERALQSDPAFRRLPPERQQMLRQRLQHFSSLPPQQQQRMLNRMETWEHLTPEQKQQARQVHGALQQLPPERRRMVTTAVRDLSSMPPRQREQIIDSPRFRSMFSPQEREIMRGASRLPLAPPDARREEGSQPQ
ncbi:MAG TPA: DUF3106 domain-containing protein [Candidatus Eremiobacteraceae bacterium]|nr:DUF3106 domain-containing protein [Candidatus Eremiobacteraceae bacterium]